MKNKIKQKYYEIFSFPCLEKVSVEIHALRILIAHKNTSQLIVIRN